MKKLLDLFTNKIKQVVLHFLTIFLTPFSWLFPKSTWVFSLLGKANMKKKNWEKAILAFNKSLSINASQPEILFLLGKALEGAGKFSEAKHKYRTAAQLGYKNNFLEKRLIEISKNILVFYGHLGSNFGDLGITLGTINLIRTINPKSKITFVILPLSKLGEMARNYLLSQYLDIEFIVYDIKSVQSELNVNDLTVDKLQTIYKNYYHNKCFKEQLKINDMDLVIYNSGEHLFAYDKENSFHLLVWTLPYIVASKSIQKSICLPSTFGPFNTKEAKEIIKEFLLASTTVYAREKRSLEFIENEFGSLHKNIEYGPDPAFFISNRFIKQFLPIIQNKTFDILLIPRLENYGLRAGKENSTEYIEKLRENDFFNSMLVSSYVKLIEYVSLQKDYKWVLLAQTNADKEICEAIYKKTVNKFPTLGSSLTIVHPQDFSGYLALLGSSKNIVASRFHSIIFTYLLGNNPIGIYSPTHGVKIPGLMEYFHQANRCFSTKSISIIDIYKLIKDGSNTECEESIKYNLLKDKEVLLQSLKSDF